MPRAGQAARRKAKAAQAEESDSDDYYVEESSGGQGGGSIGNRKLRALPVAEIDDSWEGEPEDGATYLALVNRANAKLPSFTRVLNPYRQPSPPPIVHKVSLREDGQPEAGPSRHPALPKESWTVSFISHFQNYRKDVRSRWPPEPLPPLPDDMIPFPDRDQRHEWFFFIVGFNRRKINKRSERPSTDHQPASGKEKAWSPSRPMQTSSTVKAPDAMEEDEEEAMMNAPLPVAPTHTNTSGNDNNNDDDGLENVTKDDNEETWDEEIARRSFRYDLEPETAKHRPRAPTISVLSRLSQHQIITIIIQIGYRLNTQIEHLSSDLSFDPAPSSVPTPSSGSASSTPNPFTSHLCQWSFALLALLDPNLTADDLHHVREFARVIMRVGGWRYLRALQDGEIDAHWVLGQSWATPSDEQTIGQDGRKEGRGEEGVDETLARCWMIVLAIVAGWAQHDLLESLENLFK